MKHHCDRDGRVTYCYREHSMPTFDPVVFDENRLAENDQLEGIAEGGRGNTFFIKQADTRLVLRHYRRGGMVRHFSEAAYLFTGIERTRAWREFMCLGKLESLQLPAARAFACRIDRHGFYYTASLVTYQLDGVTLATRLIDDSVELEDWERIGHCIARFHRAGICHADLNAHNILLDDNGTVSLIDFDRARLFDNKSDAYPTSWSRANIERLKRSVDKTASDSDHQQAGFDLLRKAWRDA